MLTYCRRCVMPSSKPDLFLDDSGICNACRSFENRSFVDWDARRREFFEVLDRYRRIGNEWDCIIPVSGGKDSTYQVLRILEAGLNPLCVCATTCDFSDIGRRNLDNLKRLGVDCLEVTPNPLVRSKLNRIGLIQVGDISWPEHVAIFTTPVSVAVRYNIPLIIWGENSQNEYGGPASSEHNNVLDRAWLEEFGGLLGMRVEDVVGLDGLSNRDLMPYTYPSDEELKKVGVTGLFLGYYFPWDGLANALVSQAHGFEVPALPTLGSMVNYENLDNYQTAIHEYFKFLKFGFGRATDHACLHIRRGRLSRGMALDIVRRLDGKFPASYLGKPLQETLEPLGLSESEFVAICDDYTNRDIFQRDRDGDLIKSKDGSVVKLNYDNI